MRGVILNDLKYARDLIKDFDWKGCLFLHGLYNGIRLHKYIFDQINNWFHIGSSFQINIWCSNVRQTQLFYLHLVFRPLQTFLVKNLSTFFWQICFLLQRPHRLLFFLTNVICSFFPFRILSGEGDQWQFHTNWIVCHASKAINY